MKARVIRIGNSRGVRIPKTLLEQCGLRETVELEMENGHLVLRSSVAPRRGWDEAFRHMHRHGDDKLLDKESSSPTKWDKAERQW